MPKRITYIECDCGKQYEIKPDGSVGGARVGDWELTNTIRLDNSHLEVRFRRYYQCDCWATLKTQKASRRFTVSVDESTVENEETEE